MRLRTFAVAFAAVALLAVLALPAWAGYLPPGREADVKALVWGPELPGLGLDVRGVAIQRSEISVTVAGAASGVLHLGERADAPRAFAQSPSFAMTWTSAEPGPPPAPVQAWAAQIAGRDSGQWWISEAAPKPATDRQVPSVAWAVLVGGALWLLLAVAAVAAAGPGAAHALAWSLVPAAATLLTAGLLRRDTLSHASREAIAGRASGPVTAVAAVWRWQLHLPEAVVDLASSALLGLLVGLALLGMAPRLVRQRHVPSLWIAAAATLIGPAALLGLGLQKGLWCAVVLLSAGLPWRGRALPVAVLSALLASAQLVAVIG